ncbi:MAG: hypothetical protein K2X27_20865, partial [Candidatus Obscuribacterales bacterium]|nr:hypothetical protein [Candidatus Obscuribacterales bacterium]
MRVKQNLSSIRKIATLAILFSLSQLAMQPSSAQDAAGNAPQSKFALSASVQERVQEREIAFQQMPQMSSSLPQTAIPPEARMSAAPVLPTIQAPLQASATVQEERPNSYMEEYQVN